MKVILLADVRGLGKKHEVREVSDGHARNFLLPKNLAKPATDSALRELKALQSRREEESAAELKRLRDIASRLGGNKLEFKLKTDSRGSVFGSITKEKILSALRDRGYLTSERAEILLAHPIKEFGEHKIRVDLKKGIEAELTLLVLPQP